MVRTTIVRPPGNIGGVKNVVDQLAPDCLVIAQSEDLFELIDQDEQPMVFGAIIQRKSCGKVKTALLVLRTLDKPRERSQAQRSLLVRR
jgi:hypothetical protein